jgi:hypothetical protein
VNEGRKNDNLVEPGDVVVLNVTPWMASDDTIFGAKSLEGEDEELGMQIVVETSIFNNNAELPPSKRERDVPLATCHDSDLLPLASVALKINNKLAESNFVDIMVEKMKTDEALGEKQMSPFYFAFEDGNLAKESQVVTSWTIKTDIGAGSSLIDFVPIVRIHINFMFLALFSPIIALTCWGVRPWLIGKRASAMTGTIEKSDQTPRKGRRRKFARSSLEEYHPTHDGVSIMAIADDYQDNRSTVTCETDASGGESFRSFGSLSVYMARLSRFPRKT